MDTVYTSVGNNSSGISDGEFYLRVSNTRRDNDGYLVLPYSPNGIAVVFEFGVQQANNEIYNRIICENLRISVDVYFQNELVGRGCRLGGLHKVCNFPLECTTDHNKHKFMFWPVNTHQAVQAGQYNTSDYERGLVRAEFWLEQASTLQYESSELFSLYDESTPRRSETMKCTAAQGGFKGHSDQQFTTVAPIQRESVARSILEVRVIMTPKPEEIITPVTGIDESTLRYVSAPPPLSVIR